MYQVIWQPHRQKEDTELDLVIVTRLQLRLNDSTKLNVISYSAEIARRALARECVQQACKVIRRNLYPPMYGQRRTVDMKWAVFANT